MVSLGFRKISSVTIAALAAFCLAAPHRLAAASPDNSANITFTAQGTFATTAVSGSDQLKLAGQPFTISIVANSSLKPSRHGRNWAQFDALTMQGTIYTGLVPNQPIAIASKKAVIAQIVSVSKDIFQAGFPVQVIGIKLEAVAYITLPGGTMINDLIRPFASVPLDPTNATITYKDATASTVLAVQSGTIVAALPTGASAEQAMVAAPPALMLLAGAQGRKPRGLSAIWE